MHILGNDRNDGVDFVSAAVYEHHGYTVSTPNDDEWLDAEFGQLADELFHFLDM